MFKNNLRVITLTLIITIGLLCFVQLTYALECVQLNTNVPACHARRPHIAFTNDEIQINCFSNTTYGTIVASTTSDSSSGVTLFTSDSQAQYAGYIYWIKIAVLNTQTSAKTNKFFIVRRYGTTNTFFTVSSHTLTSTYSGKIQTFTPSSPILIQKDQYLAVYSTSQASTNLITRRTSETGITEFRMTSQQSTTIGAAGVYTPNSNRAASITFMLRSVNPTAPAGCPGEPFCRYDFGSNQCAQESPSSCYQYYNDTIGCTNNLFVPINACYVASNGQCTAYCTTNYTVEQCVDHTSECHVNNSPEVATQDTCFNVPKSYGDPICDNGAAA